MNTEPDDVDRGSLASCIAREWQVGHVSLAYVPVGFGAHHYLARGVDGARWFVTVDEIAAKSWLGNDPPSILAGLERALRTAVAFRQHGFSFVHAPLESESGAILTRLDGKYAVSVYAWIDGEPGAFGVDLPPATRRLLFQALGSLHARTDVAPVDLHSDDARVPLRAELTAAMANVHVQWSSGPYGESTRRALAARSADVQRGLEAFDELVQKAAANPVERVVTHGEPHGGNVMRTSRGELRLIDWDTVALGPRERDLAIAFPRDDKEWAAYTSSGPSPTVNKDMIRLYQQLWILTDVSLSVDQFRRPHQRGPDAEVTWRGLNSALDTLAREDV